MSIGRKLKQARIEKDLTQEELSEKLGVSRQTISSWENERTYPDILRLIELSDLYQLTLDSLLKGEDEMLKELQKQTDTVRSNRQLVRILLLMGGVYLSASFIQTFFSVPKIVHPLFNGGLLVVLIGVLLWKGTTSSSFKRFLEAKTANKSLMKVVVGSIYLVGLLILPEIINRAWLFEGYQWLVRVSTALILAVPCGLLFKQLK